MTTQIDWQHELDASFGSGEDVPVGHYVAVGQRAVRRRRRTTVAAGLAAAAVAAGVAWGIAPGSGPSRSEAPIATDPSTERADATADNGAPMTAMPWSEGTPPARFVGDGVEVRDGAVVHERRDDLYPDKETESVALDISYEGERWWMTLEWDADGAAMTSSPVEDDPHDTFDEFIAAAVSGGGMTSGPANEDPAMGDALVTWHGGEVDPAPGVTVVRQVDGPVPGDESIGLVLRSEGRTTWMLLTQGGAAASWSLESDSGWATFDQWLADQVALQTGSRGLRLVKLADDGTVSATTPGVVVLDQQADPEVPAYGTDEASASAVGLVSWQGERWFVLLVRFPDEAAVTTVAASKAPGVTTLDEFVSFMADRADEGGMR